MVLLELRCGALFGKGIVSAVQANWCLWWLCLFAGLCVRSACDAFSAAISYRLASDGRWCVRGSGSGSPFDRVTSQLLPGVSVYLDTNLQALTQLTSLKRRWGRPIGRLP